MSKIRYDRTSYACIFRDFKPDPSLCKKPKSLYTQNCGRKSGREQARSKEKVKEKSKKQTKPAKVPKQQPRITPIVTENSEVEETDRDKRILRPRPVTRYEKTRRRTVREKKRKASSNQPQTKPKQVTATRKRGRPPKSNSTKCQKPVRKVKRLQRRAGLRKPKA
jgi:hypothetical protein